jgi:uncharacterized damage-inducible protein DinB
MSIEHYKKLFRYNFWANDKVWNCILKLSDEQFTRACDYSIGSIHAQIVHQMTAEELWLGRIIGTNQPKKLGDPADYPSRDSIVQSWSTIQGNWFAYLDNLTENELDARLEFVTVTTGTCFSCLRWEGLTEILNHSTDHRAKILSLIHQVGGETTAQDFIYHVWDM